MRFSLCLRKNPLNLKTCVNASNSVGQDTCVEITCKTAGNCQQLSNIKPIRFSNRVLPPKLDAVSQPWWGRLRGFNALAK